MLAKLHVSLYLLNDVLKSFPTILKYVSVIWDPQYAAHSDRIESMQFLLFCLRRLRNEWDTNIRLPSYENLIKLQSKKIRRKILDVAFLLKLINGVINSQFLLEK